MFRSFLEMLQNDYIFIFLLLVVFLLQGLYFMFNMLIVFKYGNLQCGILIVYMYYLIMKILYVYYLKFDKVLKEYKKQKIIFYLEVIVVKMKIYVLKKNFLN